MSPEISIPSGTASGDVTLCAPPLVLKRGEHHGTVCVQIGGQFTVVDEIKLVLDDAELCSPKQRKK